MVHLFFGADYYPDGGMHDYRGAFATIDAAKEAASALKEADRCGASWGQIAQANEKGELRVILEWSRQGNLYTKLPADQWVPVQS